MKAEKAYKHLKEKGIDGLVVIGGDGSFRGADTFQKNLTFLVLDWPALLTKTSMVPISLLDLIQQ
jgi:6-phosphofructokinase 1